MHLILTLIKKANQIKAKIKSKNNFCDRVSIGKHFVVNTRSTTKETMQR